MSMCRSISNGDDENLPLFIIDKQTPVIQGNTLHAESTLKKNKGMINPFQAENLA